MKKNMKYIGLIFFAMLLFSGDNLKAQCNPDALAQECVPKLADGFTFLKSFKINGQGGARQKVEYSYVFSKDTQYFINICANGEGTDGIVVTMYDSKRQIVSTNYQNGKFYPGIVYPCNATGIYYITFTFNGSSSYCGGSVLGFKR
ncbi:MAG TPA: hypothetical protein DDY13_07745 [Cytophagales bacterium]|jgi:hypothetical protein|nr:hypothetical protein [Cytophagales bacterium]